MTSLIDHGPAMVETTADRLDATADRLDATADRPDDAGELADSELAAVVGGLVAWPAAEAAGNGDAPNCE
jgi:hypothetical protein